MQDITQYSDNELSLLVYNDESLYNIREERDYLLALLDEQFIYTNVQLSVLLNDLDDEEAEEV